MSMTIDGLADLLSSGALLTSEADRANYSYDAALDRACPDAIVVARTVTDVSRTVAYCAAHHIPFTARGAGTNLSGGCIPLRGGIVISLARLNHILEIDTAGGFAIVEPGVVNQHLQQELEKLGFFYAPDPASMKVSTLGGNIAENAGGPRCLKYGVTTNHVLAVEAVMPDGSIKKFSLEDSGSEMVSLLVGSEGTLGIILKAWVKITPLPETVVTLLAGFASIDAAVACVAAIIAGGVLPRALEAMDKVTVDSVEGYIKAGYPKTEAVLLIELDGRPADVARDAQKVEVFCHAHGVQEFRAAADKAQRDRLWEGRRGAYAAVARLAPNVLVEDGVVPRDQLPAVVRRIQEIAAHRRILVALLFHAGDGNIHPNIAYDERNSEETARVKLAGFEMLQACVELGGSLSGEHGIGMDKREAMAWLFTPETLALFRRIKSAIDPGDIANPDKIFPDPTRPKQGYHYMKPASRALSKPACRLVDQVLQGAGQKMAIIGSGSRSVALPKGQYIRLETADLNSIVDLDKNNYTVTVETGITLEALHAQLQARECYVRLPASGGTLGGLLATKAWGGVREDLLGMRLLLADGKVVELGGKVVKNVAGYDVPRLLLGSWGTLGVILEVTYKMYSFPIEHPVGTLTPQPFAANEWQRKIQQAFDPANTLNSWLI